MVHSHRGALTVHGSHRETGCPRHPPLVASKCLSQDSERQEATGCDRDCLQDQTGWGQPEVPEYLLDGACVPVSVVGTLAQVLT